VRGTLYVVATPLGNLGDLSPRAAETLKRVAAVAAEDTRRTRPLLAHVGSGAELVSVHAHSPAAAIERVLRQLAGGRDVALVTDAGTPAVSDPGVALVAAARARDFPVVTIPGPTAVAAALAVSGLSATDTCFSASCRARAGSGNGCCTPSRRANGRWSCSKRPTARRSCSTTSSRRVAPSGAASSRASSRNSSRKRATGPRRAGGLLPGHSTPGRSDGDRLRHRRSGARGAAPDPEARARALAEGMTRATSPIGSPRRRASRATAPIDW
jgi:hypothetical protein